MNKEFQTATAINKIFDLAEKCIMEYICYYYEMQPEKLFIEFNIPVQTMPLLINPIEDYSKNILSLSIDIVPHDHVSNIPADLLNNTIIIELIQFIHQGVNSVLDAILNSNIQKDASAIINKNSIYLEFDSCTNTMYPIYIFPEKRRKIALMQFRDEIKNKMINENKMTDENTKAEYTKQYEDLTAAINSINYDIDYVDVFTKQMNNKLKNSKRIGIIFAEISTKQ